MRRPIRLVSILTTPVECSNTNPSDYARLLRSKGETNRFAIRRTGDGTVTPVYPLCAVP